MSVRHNNPCQTVSQLQFCKFHYLILPDFDQFIFVFNLRVHKMAKCATRTAWHASAGTWRFSSIYPRTLLNAPACLSVPKSTTTLIQRRSLLGKLCSSIQDSRVCKQVFFKLQETANNPTQSRQHATESIQHAFLRQRDRQNDIEFKHFYVETVLLQGAFCQIFMTCHNKPRHSESMCCAVNPLLAQSL